jgi:hypothetical protein
MNHRVLGNLNLITAARRRHELTRAKALKALRELDRAGLLVTFQALASAALLSRSWLYAQPDIHTQIQRLRDRALTVVPARQRASVASLLRRLEAASARNRQLTQDNDRLRRQLAHAIGRLRAAGQPSDPPRDPASARRHPLRANGGVVPAHGQLAVEAAPLWRRP